MITYTVSSLSELSELFAKKAATIRQRVPSASPTSKRIMQAEAHAYEQAASIIGATIIDPTIA